MNSRTFSILAAAAVCLIIAPQARATAATLKTAVNPANGHTYHLIESTSWILAEEQALALGGHLVTIDDAAENQWVTDTFVPPGANFDVWIGFRDPDLTADSSTLTVRRGEFQWVSGASAAYSNWQATEPNSPGSQSFVMLARGTGLWSNVQDNRRPGIVEIDPGQPAVDTRVVRTLTRLIQAGQNTGPRMTLGSDGVIYGSLGNNGVSGTPVAIVRWTDAGEIEPLHTMVDFRDIGPLTEGPDGWLYGVAALITPLNKSAVFKVSKIGELALVKVFDGAIVNPQGRLAVTSEAIWGLASVSGETRLIVFKCTHVGVLTEAATLSTYSSSGPAGGLIQASDGNLYGTVASTGDDPDPGDTVGPGYVFKIASNGAFSVLHTFDDPHFGLPAVIASATGNHPIGGVRQGPDGALYGVTQYGGAVSPDGRGYGLIYRLTLGGGFSVLHEFGAGEESPMSTFLACDIAPVTGPDGKLYGTLRTSAGPSVFRISTAGVYETVRQFASSDGTLWLWPFTPCFAANGTLVWPTSPAANMAALVRMDTGGTVIENRTLGYENGRRMPDGLTEGPGGSMYGTTFDGGASNKGTVFRVSTAGVRETLAHFTGANGSKPKGQLALASDGHFYGATYEGGANNEGTVFRITAAGVLTTLHSFTPATGRWPYAGLVEGADGALYGTTSGGGTSDHGVIFRITKDGGTYSVLHSLTGADHGANPEAPLLLASDGNFYGVTTNNGGASRYGTIFRITPGGVFTVLRALTNSDGGYPTGRLLELADGSLIGTATQRGLANGGTIFKIKKDGTGFTVQHHFENTKGRFPSAGLTLASNGRIYGVTSGNGPQNNGTLFEFSPGGTGLTVIHAFSGMDGLSPQGHLTEGDDGRLYGACYESITNLGQAGTVFRADIPSLAPEIAVHSGISTASPQLADGQVAAVEIHAAAGIPTTMSFTIANSGGRLDVDEITVTPGFSLLNAPVAPFHLGGTVTFQIQMSAAPQGSFGGIVSIASNDADESTFDYPLTGVVHPFTIGTLWNSGFEFPEDTVADWPQPHADWAGSPSQIVTAENGILPTEGQRMMKFTGTGGGTDSWMGQLVDVSHLGSLIDAGRVSVSFNAKFNRVAGTASTDNNFIVYLGAHQGNPADYVTTAVYLDGREADLFSDGDPATWQQAGISGFVLPAGTGFLDPYIAARENIANGPAGSEFDGHYADACVLTITILSVAEKWRLDHFGTTSSTGTAADTADPDFDTIQNLLERAFGLDPNVADASLLILNGAAITQRGMPATWVQNTGTGVDFRATFCRLLNHAEAGLTYSVQFSGDLITWQNSAAAPVMLAQDGEVEVMSVPYPYFVNGKKARFFRVSVSSNP